MSSWLFRLGLHLGQHLGREACFPDHDDRLQMMGAGFQGAALGLRGQSVSVAAGMSRERNIRAGATAIRLEHKNARLDHCRRDVAPGTARSRQIKKQQSWMREHVTDPYVKRANAEGFRSRAAYKLQQIAGKDRLLAPGMTVVDLGAAPGGWSQVAAKAVGDEGFVLAVDLLEMPQVPGVSSDPRRLRRRWHAGCCRAGARRTAGGPCYVRHGPQLEWNCQRRSGALRRAWRACARFRFEAPETAGCLPGQSFSRRRLRWVCRSLAPMLCTGAHAQAGCLTQPVERGVSGG